MDENHFGQALSRARTAADLTQQQLGDRLGVTQQAVARWENTRYPLRGDKVAKLEEIIGAFWSDKPRQVQYQRQPSAVNRMLVSESDRPPLGDRPRPGDFAAQFEVELAERLPDEMREHLKVAIHYMPRRRARFDYVSAKGVADIQHARSTPLNRLFTAAKLWTMSTCKRALEDKRPYFLLIHGADSAHMPAVWAIASEAQLHDIQVIPVTDVQHAAQVLVAIEHDQISFDFDDPDADYYD